MKRVLLLTLLVSFLFSCGNENNREDRVKQNVEELIKKSMDDPKSYEFVSIEVIDSVTYKDNIDYRKEHFVKSLNMNRDNIDFYTEIGKNEEIEKYQLEMKKDSLIIDEINSIEQKLGDEVNKIASYTYQFKCRGNNKFGAKILVSYYVQTDFRNDSIINITDDIDKLYLNPTDFPGYIDLLNKYRTK